MSGSHLTTDGVLEDMKSDELYRFDVEGIKNLEHLQ